MPGRHVSYVPAQGPTGKHHDIEENHMKVKTIYGAAFALLAIALAVVATATGGQLQIH